MRTYQQRLNYEKLELISPQLPKYKSKKLAPLSSVRQLWQTFLDFFWALEADVRIGEVVDRNGRVSWQIYDPVSDRFLRLDPQEQVLTWLEERHHQRQESNGWNNNW
jgi:hypothetical protein